MTLFTKSEFRAVWDAMKPDIATTRLFFDPLAVPLTVLFAKTGRISANAVTFSALVPGLAGAGCFAAGWFGLGAAGYYVFFLLDTIDGKLARLLGKGDPLGAFHDFVVDRIVIGAMLLGMGWSFAREGRFAEFLLVQTFLLLFFLKDVFDLKWKEGRGAAAVQGDPPPRGRKGWCARYKIHFKPGQLLSCFIMFVLGPITGAYVACALLAIACVAFSLAHNVLFPWLAYLRRRR